MTEGTEFAVYFVCYMGTVGCLVLLAFNADRIVVALVAYSGLPLFPLAMSIANLVYQKPDEWSAGSHKMTHRKVGSIWTANCAHGLHVETDFGCWKPNWIERRIIYDAVRWRIGGYIANQVAHAVNGGLLS
jgi:hypothetical protein